MSKRSFRTALIIVIGTLAILAGVIGFFVHRALSYPDGCPDGTSEVDKPGQMCKSDKEQDVEVEIVSGMSFPAIASLLADKKLIERPTWFRLFAMWDGKTTEVKTGKYLIKNTRTPREILDILVAGVKEVTVKVTLPEGKHMLEYFEILSAAKVADAKALEALARDKQFLAKYAITGDTIDGYLFPDTYQFRLNEKPQVVLERLLNRHREVWNELVNKHPKDTAKLKDKLGWTDRDILTMASIVEKEAVAAKERPRIAQVFINRLTSPTFKPKKLETDPTIRYGCLVPPQKSQPCTAWIEMCTKVGKAAGCERLRSAQLNDKDNPYNTYEHEGLPPGPISNPGKASIEATLSPDGSDYYFFVATSKGSTEHAFAKTMAEHEKNVAKYVQSGD
ncbi:MAG: endolytic transglycosylase MltG [Myxococcota bacterium]|nr:endolytic transglycosylase MltG [Deltaproteobacteria bacterium]MDQ3334907.1 endolytic transglycosylase MltG [Myxococcota bacterium]